MRIGRVSARDFALGLLIVLTVWGTRGALAGPNMRLQCVATQEGIHCTVCDPGAGIASITVYSLDSDNVARREGKVRKFNRCICGNCDELEMDCWFQLDRNHRHLIVVEQWADKAEGDRRGFVEDPSGITDPNTPVAIPARDFCEYEVHEAVGRHPEAGIHDRCQGLKAGDRVCIPCIGVTNCPQNFTLVCGEGVHQCTLSFTQAATTQSCSPCRGGRPTGPPILEGCAGVRF